MEPTTFQLCKRTASFFYVQNELPVSTYTCTFQTGSATIEELILKLKLGDDQVAVLAKMKSCFEDLRSKTFQWGKKRTLE